MANGDMERNPVISPPNAGGNRRVPFPPRRGTHPQSRLPLMRFVRWFLEANWVVFFVSTFVEFLLRYTPEEDAVWTKIWLAPYGLSMPLQIWVLIAGAEQLVSAQRRPHRFTQPWFWKHEIRGFCTSAVPLISMLFMFGAVVARVLNDDTVGLLHVYRFASMYTIVVTSMMAFNVLLHNWEIFEDERISVCEETGDHTCWDWIKRRPVTVMCIVGVLILLRRVPDKKVICGVDAEHFPNFCKPTSVGGAIKWVRFAFPVRRPQGNQIHEFYRLLNGTTH